MAGELPIDGEPANEILVRAAVMSVRFPVAAPATRITLDDATSHISPSPP